MKDTYPSQSAIPKSALVPAEAQPEYGDVPGRSIPEMANVGHLLSTAQVESGRGDLSAAIQAETGKSYTYSQLARLTDCLAAGLLRLGIRLGDRIAFRSSNIIELLAVVLGIWKAGAVAVPVPAQARASELKFILDDTGARLLFVCDDSSVLEGVNEGTKGTRIETVFVFGDGESQVSFPRWDELMDEAGPPFGGLDTPSDSVAVLWHTGGTTGRPKACYHTHKRYLLGGYAIGEATGCGPGQIWAVAAPVGHALGLLHNTNFTLLHGATVVMIEQFAEPEILMRAITDHRITTMTALMATWAKTLAVIEEDPSCDLTSLERCYAMWQSSSSQEVYDRWKSHGIELLNNFGSTAFATWVLAPGKGEHPPRAALGRPSPGFDVRAVEVEEGKVREVPQGTVGQMAVRGPTGLTYWNRPDMQQRDVVQGWTLSDDLIKFDPEGNAHYFGRTDYMISSAGHKIPPVEVETVLSSHRAVREVAVVPAPCPIRQQVVAAFVALNSGWQASDDLRQELQILVKAELAHHKYPRYLEFVDALPRDPVGKVMTSRIKQWADELAR